MENIRVTKARCRKSRLGHPRGGKARKRGNLFANEGGSERICEAMLDAGILLLLLKMMSFVA